MKHPCNFMTDGRRCPLQGHRTDTFCKCEDQKLKVCWHFYCSYHYLRVKEHFDTHAEEMEFFQAWCEREGVSDPARLWDVFAGEVKPHPRDPYSICHVSEIITDAVKNHTDVLP